MKRKILSLILVFAMTVSLLTVGTGAVEPTYGDTAGHWAESSIERWSAYGIIQGSNGQFDPNGQLTCAQLATILAKLLKLPAAKDAGFTDNTADAWYYDAINRCAAAGILNGNGDGTVTPEAPITRERAMVMLARALGIEPIRKPDLTKYTDAAQVSAYAQGYVAALIEAGIVGGVTADELAPQDNITRAATVTILDRAISTYADKAGATVKADGKGLVLVVAENVKITGAPEGTKIVVADGATGLTVNGKSVSDDQTYIVPKTTTGSGSSSSGGYSHSHSYDTTTHKCSCGEFDPAVVATIGNTNGYLTLEAAVAAAQSGDIVKLVKDTSENIIIPNGKTIVIDLNGKKLTNADSHTIVNNGNLTIQGSGTVDNVTHQKAALVNYGTAVLNGGTYTRSLENPENNKDNSGGNSYYTILNDKGGNMTINAGVEVTNVGHFSSMICNGGDANSSAMSKLTIHGGVFSGGINTVKNDELGELTITDGSFSNASQCVIMNWHKANISGGTFETNEGAETVLFTAKYHDTRAIGKLTLTGGTYICKTDQALLCDRYNNDEKYLGTASIAGGTFSRQPDAKYIAAGYEAKNNGNGTWTVSEKTGVTLVAQVGVNKYASLADALAAVQDGDTVKLVSDITTNTTIEVTGNKTITIDLAEKKITSTADAAIVNNGTGKLTITGNGTVDTSSSTNGENIAIWARTGSIDIENGTFINKSNKEATVYAGTSADTSTPVITIKGGTFKNSAEGTYTYNSSLKPLTLNVQNGKPVTSIVITGGTFVGQNPGDGDDNKGGTFLAEGYITLVNGDGTFTVSNTDEIPVTTATVQDYLDGKYGSINGKTLVLGGDNYGKIEFGRATAYAGSNTEYYLSGTKSTPDAIKQDIADHPKGGAGAREYVRYLSNVTLKAADNATVSINGLVAFGGQVSSTKWYSRDFVADRDMSATENNNICYWIGQNWSNITFEGLTFTDGVNIEAYGNDKTNIDNVRFDNCQFSIVNNANETYCIRLNVDGNVAEANNLIVAKCVFTNGLTAVLTDGMPNVTITDSTFSGLVRHAINPMMGNSGAPGYGIITVTGNTFKNMSTNADKGTILRMGEVGAGAVFTIQNNTATEGITLANSIKVTSLADDGITYNISGNNWGSLTASDPKLNG